MTARISKSLAASLASQHAGPAKGSNKYGAKRTAVGDLTFASKREAKRYCELRILQASGAIRDLTLQPRFPLKVNGKLVCTYVADFEYATAAGERVVEDAKGHRTREYINKAKLFEALYGFPVREV